jgi:hypothetical protein
MPSVSHGWAANQLHMSPPARYVSMRESVRLFAHADSSDRRTEKPGHIAVDHEMHLFCRWQIGPTRFAFVVKGLDQCSATQPTYSPGIPMIHHKNDTTLADPLN